jgi:hypothetical protein
MKLKQQLQAIENEKNAPNPEDYDKPEPEQES